MSGIRSTRKILSCVPLTLVLFLAGAVEARARSITLAETVVLGNQRIESETVQYYLALDPGQAVTPGEINEALRALQETGLFEDVALEVAGSSLIVRVQERPFVNEVVFEGNDILADDALAAGIRTRSRTVYSAATVEADAVRIVDLYARAGRLAATVEPNYIERDNNRVDIVFEIDEGPVSRVRRVAFVGNRVFSDWTLRRVVNSREAAWYRIFASTDLFDPGRLDADKALLARYYAGRGYADFEVLSAVASLTESGSGFVITFTVREGERYDFGEVSLESEVPEIDPQALRELIEFDTGDVFDGIEVEQTAEAIQGDLERAGSPFVEVDVETRKNADARTLDVRYRIVAAEAIYVERIQIDGNIRTLDSVIRREFTFMEGDAFNRTKLAATRRKLRGLGFFSSINLRVEDGSRPDRVVVHVEVEEQSTGSLSFGVGYSTVDKVIGSLKLTERNLLGRGQEVTMSFETSDGGDLYQLAFTEPRFRGRDLAVGIDLYRSQDEAHSTQTYELRRMGVVPTVEFPLSDETRMNLNYRLESQDTDRVSGTSDLVRREKGTTVSSSTGYQLVWDKRDDPLQPSSGTIVTLQQQVAGLGGDTRSILTELTGNYFRPLDQEGSMIGSLRFWGGAVAGFGGYELEGADRFYVGGARLRGFSYGGVGPRDPVSDEALGGKFYAVASAELLSDVLLPEELGVRAGVFVDVGTVSSLDRNSYTRSEVSGSREKDATENGGSIACTTASGSKGSRSDCKITVDDSARIRSSVGAQLLWSSPIGPMRFVFAKDVKSESYDIDESFRFIIGSPF